MNIDLSQVQSLVLRGYRVLEAHPYQHYAYLKLHSKAAAQAWLKSILPRVTRCTDFDKQEGPFVLAVAFSHHGLSQLGAPTGCDWPAPFTDGMAKRAEILGDTGQSAPSKWTDALGGSGVDVVVSIAGVDEVSIKDGIAEVEGTLGPEIERLGFDNAAHLAGKPAGTEHFGFVDGIGQPYVEGSGLSAWPGEGTPTKHGWTPIKAGEFVLGYAGETGSTADAVHPFLKNGSYFALRKLSERVAAFREYVTQTAKLNKLDADLVAAKMVGRWQSGTPLVGHDRHDDQAVADDPDRNNDFRYKDDKKGHACPFGAHIRRANPRDDPTGPTIDQVRRHRIIRRALPYGTWLPEGTQDDKDRGVMFGVINADIANQFEYVQRNWMNATISSRGLSVDADKDPLVGANDGTGKHMIPHLERPGIAFDLPRFVDVRGGGYFFVPSLDSLALLAGAQ